MYYYFRNTVGKQNYFTGYGILLHELPVYILVCQAHPALGIVQYSVRFVRIFSPLLPKLMDAP